MPQELPTSQYLPVNLPRGHEVKTSTCVSQSYILQNEAALASMCGSVLSSASCASHSAKSIDLILVPSNTQGTPVSVAHIGPTTTTTQSKYEYKLSEIVTREKEILFQADRDPDVELEPARENVFTVRHRSRQFFTVLEEDENDTDDKRSPTELVPSEEERNEEKTVEVDPFFNLGDSLKKLYFPTQKKRQKSKKGKDRFLKSRKIDAHKREYESDPEGKIELCKAVLEHPEFKVYKSHPELSQIEGNSEDDYFLESRKSQSLPTTPRVSPKMKRRNSFGNNSQAEIQKSGPGFSFLESVAGQMHRKKREQDQKLEQALVKISDGQIVGSRPVQPQVVDSVSTEVSVTKSAPITDIHTHHMHDFSDSAGSDLELHSPKPAFMTSLFTWGATKKVDVTNKESNMFSPSSF